MTPTFKTLSKTDVKIMLRNAYDGQSNVDDFIKEFLNELYDVVKDDSAEAKKSAEAFEFVINGE